MKRSNELKVGIFVVIIIIALGALTLKVGHFQLNKRHYSFFVEFPQVATLDKDAPVRFNGVEAGRVVAIKLVSAPEGDKVRVTLRIEGDIRIRRDAKVRIKTMGLMGEKYIEIGGGKSSQYVKAGEVISGVALPDMDEMMEHAQELSSQAQKLMQQLTELSKTSNALLKDNEDNVNKIIANLVDVAVNFDEFSADIKAHPWKLLFRSRETRK